MTRKVENLSAVLRDGYARKLRVTSSSVRQVSWIDLMESVHQSVLDGLPCRPQRALHSIAIS
jgi:hypothetical protein